MKKLFLPSLIIAGAVSATIASANAKNLAGYTITQFKADHRPLPMNVHIWYPAKSDGEEVRIGKNAVFIGDMVRAGATPKSGKHPVILLSHGSGGNAAGISWIASELATHGIIVVAPNHPGTTSGDSSALNTVKTWERPMDLSGLIDELGHYLPANIEYDAEKIGAVGFSLGGYSVLASAGVRANVASYSSYCDRNVGKLDCGWLVRGGVDFSKIDKPRFEQSHFDKRIKLVSAIDPGLVAAFTQDSMKKINIPIQIVNMGDSADVPEGINGQKTASQIIGTDYVQVKQASHFSFLSVCTKKGEFILKDTNDDPVCTDPGGRSREDIHKEIAEKITNFIIKTFKIKM